MERKTKQNSTGCLKVVLWILGVGSLLIAISAYYFLTHIGDWTRAGSAMMVEELGQKALQQSSLSMQDQKELQLVIDEFVQKIRDEEVSLVQGMAVIAELSTGTILTMGISETIKNKYILQSGLEPAEKEQATLAINRLVKGVAEKRISIDKLESIMEISTRNAPGPQSTLKRVPKETLSDAEVRQLASEARVLADNAGVPTTLNSPNLPSILREAIQYGMQTKNLKELEERFQSDS